GGRAVGLRQDRARPRAREVALELVGLVTRGLDPRGDVLLLIGDELRGRVAHFLVARLQLLHEAVHRAVGRVDVVAGPEEEAPGVAPLRTLLEAALQPLGAAGVERRRPLELLLRALEQLFGVAGGPLERDSRG